LASGPRQRPVFLGRRKRNLGLQGRAYVYFEPFCPLHCAGLKGPVPPLNAPVPHRRSDPRERHALGPRPAIARLAVHERHPLPRFRVCIFMELGDVEKRVEFVRRPLDPAIAAAEVKALDRAGDALGSCSSAQFPH
jgi:hypothetical protein